MKALDPGHLYQLNNKGLDNGVQELQFFKDSKWNQGTSCDGVLNQEVVRALIDRVKFLNQQLPCPENEEILYHLRAVLLKHETRALRRRLEKGFLEPEKIAISSDGHFHLQYILDEPVKTGGPIMS